MLRAPLGRRLLLHVADPRPTGSFPATAVAGSAQTVTVNVVNNGPQTITGGQVRVAIPAGFAVGAPLPAGCVNSGPGTVHGVAGTVVTCTSGTVTSGGTARSMDQEAPGLLRAARAEAPLSCTGVAGRISSARGSP